MAAYAGPATWLVQGHQSGGMSSAVSQPGCAAQPECTCWAGSRQARSRLVTPAASAALMLCSSCHALTVECAF